MYQTKAFHDTSYLASYTSSVQQIANSDRMDENMLRVRVGLPGLEKCDGVVDAPIPHGDQAWQGQGAAAYRHEGYIQFRTASCRYLS